MGERVCVMMMSGRLYGSRCVLWLRMIWIWQMFGGWVCWRLACCEMGRVEGEGLRVECGQPRS